MTLKRFRILALLLALVLLSGCTGGGDGVSAILNTQMPAESPAPVEAYVPADEYTPEDVTDDFGAVMPADAMTDVTNAAQSDAESLEDSSSADLSLGLVAGIDAEVNPLHCKYRDLLSINSLVYESLVELDEAREPSPLLADRWTLDGDTWTFTLRSNVQFHNGDTLTADDVVASYQEIMRTPDSYWYPLLNTAVSSISAGDDSTVVVKANGSIGYMLLYAMTFPITSSGSASSAKPFGTGPYWYTEYITGISLRIEQNPLWWKRASTAITSIDGIFCATDKIALNMLEIGEIDALASEYPTISLSRQLGDRAAVDYSTNTYECIVPNLRNSILKDIAVRQALMYAIDRTTLATTVYAGLVQESEVPIIPGSWIYNAQATRYNYSPERALKLLNDAGWVDMDGDNLLEKEIDGSLVDLSLTLITYDRGTTNTRSEAVEILTQQLRLVGFDVSFSVQSPKKVYEALNNGDFDLALCAFEFSDIPNLNFLLGQSGKYNYERYASDDMEDLLRSAYNSTTAEQFQSYMYDIQLKMVDDLPILGLFFRTGLTVSRVSLGQLEGPRRGNTLRGLETSSSVE